MSGEVDETEHPVELVADDIDVEGDGTDDDEKNVAALLVWMDVMAALCLIGSAGRLLCLNSSATVRDCALEENARFFTMLGLSFQRYSACGGGGGR